MELGRYLTMRGAARREVHYALAVLAVLGAWLVRYALLPVLGEKAPFLTFYPAVMVAVWYGGVGPGLVALAISAIGGWYFSPPQGFHWIVADDLVAWAAFVVMCFLIVGLTEGMHRERRRAELVRDAAHASEQRLQLAQQVARVGTFEWNIQTGVNRWTPELERMYGLQPGGFAGTQDAWEKLVHPEDRAEAARRVKEAMEKGGFEHEWRVVWPDGSLHWLAGRAVVLKDSQGKPLRLLGVNIDITERKAAESEREDLLAAATRARAELETAIEAEREARHAADSASRTKEVFLAAASHELRTPLSAILFWAAMLRRPEVTSEKIARGLEVIERSALSQVQLIDDLLDVSRIVSGKMRIDPRPMSVTPAIQRALDIVQPASEAKGVELDLALDTEVDTILGDPERLEQVFWNLLSNAIKFTPKGGRVRITSKRGESHVEIAVRDTGQGIEPAFLPYVFEQFQQAKSGPSHPQIGLGLGLAIVRHIVEAHGGSVRAESGGLGKGASFVVTLPLMKARTGPEEVGYLPTNHERPDASDVQRLHGIRVLIVDDEPDANEAVLRLLVSYGAEVRAADSADHARDALLDWNADVLVSDIGMPGEDGYALIASLRAKGGDVARIPAIALTAHASQEDKLRLLSSGFQAHVGKPADPGDLVVLISSLGHVSRS